MVSGTAEVAIESLGWPGSRWFLTPLALGTEVFLQRLASILSDGDRKCLPSRRLRNVPKRCQEPTRREATLGLRLTLVGSRHLLGPGTTRKKIAPG